MTRGIIIGLVLIFGLLEYRFWLSGDSWLHVIKLRREIAKQDKELTNLRMRNQQLIAKINELKSYPRAIEEQARYELGMVKQGEKYYQVVDPIE
jgi:cell division protein FtsB